MLMHNILNLFFPKYCGACSRLVINSKDELCLKCDLNLIHESVPNTNKIQKALRGRVEIEKGVFFIDFTKKEGVQNTLHSIKYQNQKKLAMYIAEQLALKLGAAFFQEFDSIIPIPLHRKKLKIRGFNQSDFIAEGIQNIHNIPIEHNCLKRIKNTSSQTNKNRVERWNNVKSAFKIDNADNIIGKHILLVDDVFTTGATMEACIKTLQKQAMCKCSILTLARA